MVKSKYVMDKKRDEKDQNEEIETGEQKVSEETSMEESKESNGQDLPTGRQDELIQKVADLEEQAKRFLADYQNLQRRTDQQKMEWARLSNKELLLKLLP